MIFKESHLIWSQCNDWSELSIPGKYVMNMDISSDNSVLEEFDDFISNFLLQRLSWQIWAYFYFETLGQTFFFLRKKNLKHFFSVLSMRNNEAHKEISHVVSFLWVCFILHYGTLESSIGASSIMALSNYGQWFKLRCYLGCLKCQLAHCDMIGERTGNPAEFCL